MSNRGSYSNRAVVALSLLSLAGCAQLLGIEPIGEDAAVASDAEPSDGADEIDADETPVDACTAGCDAPAQVVPSNGATLADAEGTGALLVDSARIVTLDTNSGEIISYLSPGGTPTSVRGGGAGLIAGIRFRIASPDAAVFGVASLTVTMGSELRVIGDRPAIIVSDGNVLIQGKLDAGAGRLLFTACQECSGPGGGRGATQLVAAAGCAPGGNGSYTPTMDETGGAGGGGGSVGADGGDSDAQGGVAAPINSCSGLAVVPLLGGSGGGRGGFDTVGTLGGAAGGGGGGAVQITSRTQIQIGGSADLYAGGAGGVGTATHYGGGGGGAGGSFLFEAPGIIIASGARITANGGGGGSGRTASNGENAAHGTTRASGGAGTGTGSIDGRGGLGAVGTGGASAATPGNGDVDGTGGGGGGAGLIRFNHPTVPSIDAGAVISPPHSLGTLATSS